MGSLCSEGVVWKRSGRGGEAASVHAAQIGSAFTRVMTRLTTRVALGSPQRELPDSAIAPLKNYVVAPAKPRNPRRDALEVHWLGARILGESIP